MQNYQGQQNGYEGNTAPYNTPVYIPPVKAKKNVFGTIISIVTLVVLLANTVFIAFLFFRKPDNSMSAQDMLATQKNIQQYTRDCANDSLDVKNLRLKEEKPYPESDYTDTIIYATVKNTSDRKLTDIQIEFECYDKNGDLIDTEIAYIGADIDSKDSYELREQCYVDGVVKIKVKNMDAYYYDDINIED